MYGEVAMRDFCAVLFDLGGTLIAPDAAVAGAHGVPGADFDISNLRDPTTAAGRRVQERHVGA